MRIMNISDSAYKEIEKMIGSEESVVGIDAKKTHVMIIHLLQEIMDKLDHLEERIDDLDD
ncbi:hypothetical protein DDZ15_02225 [Rhodohalobacter mucosus]|uniref:Uncharacterized protein n=2 Tax=Rhodohalobacter mucosus TaxID=2079485 RepID=A0A316TWT1_9BACT|nr:hypothetical protein DDZ15_02225 [Rhodohalobacter mucosus]